MVAGVEWGLRMGRCESTRTAQEEWACVCGSVPGRISKLPACLPAGAESVLEAFVRLHEKGLIYRGSYMVNWSPGLQTGAPGGQAGPRHVPDRVRGAACSMLAV